LAQKFGTKQNHDLRPCARLHGRAERRLAEFERDLIPARTGEGRERATARGVKFGRKPKLSEAIRRRDPDGEPVREIVGSYNVSENTISRLMPAP
jgi:DNA invertase Pin-like site-specific DNA recombinase